MCVTLVGVLKSEVMMGETICATVSGLIVGVPRASFIAPAMAAVNVVAIRSASVGSVGGAMAWAYEVRFSSTFCTSCL